MFAQDVETQSASDANLCSTTGYHADTENQWNLRPAVLSLPMGPVLQSSGRTHPKLGGCEAPQGHAHGLSVNKKRKHLDHVELLEDMIQPCSRPRLCLPLPDLLIREATAGSEPLLIAHSTWPKVQANVRKLGDLPGQLASLLEKRTSGARRLQSASDGEPWPLHDVAQGPPPPKKKTTAEAVTCHTKEPTC